MSYVYECQQCKSIFGSEIPQSYAVEICDDCLTVDIAIDEEVSSTKKDINTTMKKWRIKRITTTKRNRVLRPESTTIFILQKRLLGFLWWYNPDNFDANITGVYESLHAAEDAYKDKMKSATVTTYLDLDDE
jgi:hypothetical protein